MRVAGEALPPRGRGCLCGQNPPPKVGGDRQKEPPVPRTPEGPDSWRRAGRQPPGNGDLQGWAGEGGLEAPSQGLDPKSSSTLCPLSGKEACSPGVPSSSVCISRCPAASPLLLPVVSGQLCNKLPRLLAASNNGIRGSGSHLPEGAWRRVFHELEVKLWTED